MTTRKLECFDHPEYPIVHIFDTPGDDGLDVSADIDNGTHAFDIVFLLINDSITESDIRLVEEIKENNMNNDKKIKLFVLKTFFDVDYLNRVNILEAKFLHKLTHLGLLQLLEDDVPFYCVSLLPKYRNTPFNDDLDMFLRDWYDLGLSERQKLDCQRTSPRTLITEDYLFEINAEIESNINRLMAGTFFWSLIPLVGSLLDKVFIRKFIKRYCILLKLYPNGNQNIKDHYSILKNLRRDSMLDDIKAIEKKYENLDVTYQLVYQQALDNFSKKYPSFKELTALFRLDSVTSVSLRTFTDIGIKTITGFLFSLIDDIAKLFPRIMPHIGAVFGIIGVGISLVFSFTAVLHIYLLTNEIPKILIDDAKVIYLIKN